MKACECTSNPSNAGERRGSAGRRREVFLHALKGVLTPKSDELPRLQTRHAAAMRVFVAVKDKDDLEACVAALEPDDVRSGFEIAFKKFAQSLDMLLPDPRALPYTGDARWLGKIRGAAAARYRDAKIDVSDCGAKVKKLIEEAVIADGIQILVKQVSLFTPEFEKKMAALKGDEARASEMEHALKDEIHTRLEEDPAFYSSLRERLEKILEDRKAKRALAEVLEEQLAPRVEIIDWVHKDEVQREMRQLIKRQLRAANYGPSELDPMATSVVELLKRRRAH